MVIARIAGIVCVLAAFTGLSAAASPPCPAAELLTAPGFHIDLGPSACTYVDAAGTVSIDTIASTENRFEPPPTGLVDFGFSNSQLWVMSRLKNGSARAGTWWITHDIPVATTLAVYLARGPGPPQQILSLTDRDVFSARPVPHRHLVSEITLDPHETATLYITYRTAQATEMPLFAETIPRFMDRTQSENVMIAFLTALVIGMGVISTIYYYGLDGKPALLYGLYVLFGGALLIHVEGYGFQYLWPGAPGFNQRALGYISSVQIALGLYFVGRFTRVHKHRPALHRLSLAVIAALPLMMIYALEFDSPIWAKTLVLVTVCLGCALQIYLAAVAVRRRQSGAAWLLIGFGALAGALIFAAIGYMTEGLFEQEIAGDVLRAAFVLEAFSFSVAIALRIRSTVVERNQALRSQLRLSKEQLDLSEALRRAEIDRQHATDQAQRSQEALASTAHDIRQPLASLQMALDSGQLAEDRIGSSLRYLDGLVRDVLEEQIEPLGVGQDNPPTESAKESFCAQIVLDGAETMFGTEAKRKGVDLHVMPCSAELIADPLSLMRIVSNLISNALSHSGATRITVGCRRRPAGLQFEVHDNGRGIPTADLADLTQRGRKTAGSDGHGLGLNIIAGIAGQNGYPFEMISPPGKGTVGRILVPSPAPT